MQYGRRHSTAFQFLIQKRQSPLLDWRFLWYYESMSITREDVMHLAELSSISLREDEIEPLTKDLDNIVNYMSQLDELDTENVEPTYQCFEMQNVWRDDEIEKFEANREDLLALTKESEDNQIKVSKVL